ncbi:nucleolar protein 16-like [Tubulanus polymorphus]|uniref:nucleolar protein 16-like n=1 Tax=Tubulanus polymorphus TaxID=672921 RepID=UPI003DA69540
MGKPKKRAKTFQYNKNRRKAWKKSKKMPNIECDKVKAAWDEKKSVSHNLQEMGISMDPNLTLKIPKAKEIIHSHLKESDDEMDTTQKSIEKNPKSRSKSYVADELEYEANLPQEQQLRLSQPEVSFCVYMLEKYGEDYKAMCRDKKNYYQDTPKQIRRRIMTFKSIPAQYQPYLASKK